MSVDARTHYDVAILGAGLAGLSLARQLLLETDRTVLLLDRRGDVPADRQKVGESTVQLGGYYLGKVLDLEEHLLRRHYMKYGLRFHWRTYPGDGSPDNTRIEDLSQSYIRAFSNIPAYQIDRNEIEGDLLRRNLENPRLVFESGVGALEVALAREDPDGGNRRNRPEPHRLTFEAAGMRRTVTAGWVVDTTGRGRYLAKKLGLTKPSPIRHGAFFWWVDGLVDVERLTDRSLRDTRLARRRRFLGHAPAWLATNHFCGEGFWFWVIPLRGKTSLGLVFDHRILDPSEVFSVEKATRWVCRELPLLARDLPHREVLDSAGFRDFAYDCERTISADRWALTGESGRFSDPLYSPGIDLIAIYNTLIVAAIETSDPAELRSRCRIAERIMRTAYAAYVPGYSRAYDTLGDQEVFSLKYAWELAAYFATYVFPFINDLFTDRRFAPTLLRQLSRLGPVNRSLQSFLSDFYQWKKANRPRAKEPAFFDFTDIGTLREAEKAFYEVGVSVEDARRTLASQVDDLEELARLIGAWAAARVLDDPRVVTSRRFVGAIDPAALAFDPEAFRRRWRTCLEAGEESEPHRWSFAPRVLGRFWRRAEIELAAAGASSTAEARREERRGASA